MDMNYRGGMWEGGGWAGWSGVGGKWYNCNSIINKYIKKKKEINNIRTAGESPHTWTLNNTLLEKQKLSISREI